MLPFFVRYEWSRFNTPIGAIIIQSITTFFLMSFKFSDLVIMDTFFNNLTLLLEFMSYLRLKYIEPDTPRGFVVPGGLKGAWIITLPKTIVITIVLVAQDRMIWAVAAMVRPYFLFSKLFFSNYILF